ncbi:MAG TPA: M15 family metallopeptidase [Polyangiaceae bacterium]|nr:M15 family metallopeptidase [Polyangiaceae bacterium]
MARSFRCLVVAFAGALAACGPSETAVDVENEPAPLVQGTVDDAVANSCSTGAVLGLSEQIVDQVNCLRPNTLAAIPARPNMTRSANTFAFMQPPARDSLVRALDAQTAMTLGVNSMLRTLAQQYLLYSWYMAGRCSIALAAAPGGSNHESGLALDTSQYAAWQTALEAEQFEWFGSSDTVHFDYRGSGTVDLRPIGVRGFQRLWNVNHAADTIAEDGIYGPMTESRLRQSPAAGFSTPAPCATPPDGGGADARAPDAADTGTPPADGGRSEAGGGIDARADRLPDVNSGGGTGNPPDVIDGGAGGASTIDAYVDAPPGADPDGASGDGSSMPPGALEAGCSCRVASTKNLRSAVSQTAWWAALIVATFYVRAARRRDR